MDHLSSCYFCGTAMDRPLQSYRVVPVELRDDDASTTATLCASCHYKLERLLAPTAEAAGASSVTLDTGPGTTGTAGRGGQDPEPAEMDGFDADPTAVAPDRADTTADDPADEPADAVPTDAGNSEDTDTSDGTASATAAVGDDPDADERDGGGGAGSGADSVAAEDDPADDPGSHGIEANLVEVDGFEDPLDPAAGGEREGPDADGGPRAAGHEDATADAVAETDAEVADGAGSTDAGDESAAGASDGTHPGASGDGAGSGADRPEEGEPESESEDDAPVDRAADTDPNTGASEAVDGSGEAGADRSDDSETPQATTRKTVTALEYNKVMRLLQNREFPVDREEIEVVAANAYGLAQEECGAVIDLAVDRGLVDERDGQLVRPE